MIIFIEPGSGIAQYFHAVAKYIGYKKTAFYSTFPKSRSKLKKLGVQVFPTTLNQVELNGNIPNYSSFEEKILNPKILLDSSSPNELKVDIHKHYHRLNLLFQTLKPSAIFLWNGSGLAASIAIYLAGIYNIKTVFGENGYFPLTMQIDSEGVNALSSMTGKFKIDDFKNFNYTNEQREIFDDLLEKIRQGKKFKPVEVQQKIKASLRSKLIHEFKSLNTKSITKPGFLLNKNIPNCVERLPEKYIFFPLQVKNDSQLINHSPIFSNDIFSMIDTVSTVVNTYLPDYKIVIKLHPVDIAKTDYTPLISKYKNIVWVKSCNIQKLLKNSDIIITVNSTAGFEALFHNKPVILLGDNFYNIPGLTYSIADKSELGQKLLLCKDWVPDAEKIYTALIYYYYNFFTQGHCKDYSVESIKNVALKILSLSK